MPLQRVISATLVSAAVVAVIAADHLLGTMAGFYVTWALIVSMALIEFYALAERAGHRPFRTAGVIAGTLVALGFHWTAVRHSPTAPLAAAGLVLLIALGVDAARRLRAGAGLLDLPSAVITIGGIGGVGFLASYLTGIRQVYDDGDGWNAAILLLWVVLITKGGDIAAYAVGRRFGRRRLAPRISPRKTWEGAAAGLAAGLAAAAAGGTLFADALLPILPAVLFGLAVGVASQVGDLAESWYKRRMKASDSSALLPGWGGILDVIDSLLLAAPVAYYLFVLLRS